MKDKITIGSSRFTKTYRLRQYRTICRLEPDLKELSGHIHREEYYLSNELIAYTLDGAFHVNRRGSIAFLLRGTCVLYSTMNGWKWKSGLFWNLKMMFLRFRTRFSPHIVRPYIAQSNT